MNADFTLWYVWASSDLARELGDRVRWAITLENHGGAWPRREAIRLRFPQQWPTARRIVDVPVQAGLFDLADIPTRKLDLGALTPFHHRGVWRWACAACCWDGGTWPDEMSARNDAILHVRGSSHRRTAA